MKKKTQRRRENLRVQKQENKVPAHRLFITFKMLEDLHACYDGLSWFADAFILRERLEIISHALDLNITYAPFLKDDAYIKVPFDKFWQAAPDEYKAWSLIRLPIQFRRHIYTLLTKKRVIELLSMGIGRTCIMSYYSWGLRYSNRNTRQVVRHYGINTGELTCSEFRKAQNLSDAFIFVPYIPCKVKIAVISPPDAPIHQHTSPPGLTVNYMRPYYENEKKDEVKKND